MPDTNARITQEPVEILGAGDANVRVTQGWVETIYPFGERPDAADCFISQAVVEVLRLPTYKHVFVTQAPVEVIIHEYVGAYVQVIKIF